VDARIAMGGSSHGYAYANRTAWRQCIDFLNGKLR